MKKSVSKSFIKLVEEKLYSKVSAVLESVKMQEAATILEDVEPRPYFKGWMSPEGKEHTFSFNKEHSRMHHPLIAKKVYHELSKKNLDDLDKDRWEGHAPSVNHALKHGFTRFSTVPAFGRNEHYIHYDRSNQKGVKSALHALNYVKPGFGDHIFITDEPWKLRGEQSDHKFYSSGDAAKYIRKTSNLREDSESFNDVYKGWMSPHNGVPHIFDFDDEHYRNQHPEIKSQIHKELERVPKNKRLIPRVGINLGLKHGYVRFGKDDDGPFIHYDSRSPKSRKAAIHALNYMKPSLNDSIFVTDRPWKEKGRVPEHIFQSPYQAAHHIRTTNSVNESYEDQGQLYRGWVSPTGNHHTFEWSEEHGQNHHPEIRKEVNKELQSKGLADKYGLKNDEYETLATSNNLGLKKGYCRYGTNHGNQYFLHYNKNAPGAKEAALHALKYMNPGIGSSIMVTDKPWNISGAAEGEHFFRNQSQAAQHIRQH